MSSRSVPAMLIFAISSSTSFSFSLGVETLMSRSTMRITRSTLGRLIRVRRMKATCWSTFGTVVMPASSGCRMDWVSTYTRAEAWYSFGRRYTTVQPMMATIQEMTTAYQRYFQMAFSKVVSRAVSSAILSISPC